MNKKSIGLICCFSLLFGLSSCQSQQTVDLQYIYEQAVAQGYTGTYEDWVASLKGSDGQDGKDGTNGKDGSSFLTGDAIPSSSLGKDGDIYFDTSTDDLYQKISGEWTLKGNIKGDSGTNGTNGINGTNGTNGNDGQDGKDGSNGNTWLSGTKDPDENTASAIGDFFINTSTWEVFLCTSTGWVSQGTIKGEKGDDYYSDNSQGLAFYLLDDGTFGVGAGSSKYLSEINIPETYQGKAVTTIVKEGFRDSEVKSISIPKSVTTIMDDAFMDCSSLNKVYYGTDETNIFTFNQFTTEFGNNVIIGKDAFTGTLFPHVEAEDSSDGSNADFTISNINSKFDSISYDISLNTLTDISAKGTIDTSNSASSINTTIDLKTYGDFKNINFTFLKDGNTVGKLKADSLAVTADEYNFALLNGTYPVLVFSLKLKDITNSGSIPTFVGLERSSAYNWNELPYNMSYMPNATRSMATGGDFHGLRPYFVSYISELYKLNSNSKFNLFCVDNYPELILQMLVANQIPETQWTATLLSDGSGTAGYLSSTFAVDNPGDKLTEMENGWNSVKEHVFDTGTYSSQYLIDNLPYSVNSPYSIMATYPYVLKKTQTNVNWWVNRLRTGENLSAITAKDSAFAQDIVNSATSFYTNNLLAALDENEKANFKSLYHFSDEMFKDAKDNNKKIMVILGTSWSGEKSTFYDYLKMTMDYYGSDYAYYYKGHPGYATVNYPDRKTMLNKLNNEGYSITELDCSIAAEVILFYNPDIYICGWSTSTFDSVESQSMACALYNIPLANKSSYTYGDMMDMFITKIASDSTWYSNTSIGLSSSKNYYIMEFNNTSTYQTQVDEYNKHEIAIYCVEDGTIKYYKNTSGSVYSEVKADGTAV